MNAKPGTQINILDYGLTKREYFAAMAMQGLMARENALRLHGSDASSIAVKRADALIDALNKDEGEE